MLRGFVLLSMCCPLRCSEHVLGVLTSRLGPGRVIARTQATKIIFSCRKIRCSRFLVLPLSCASLVLLSPLPLPVRSPCVRAVLTMSALLSGAYQHLTAPMAQVNFATVCLIVLVIAYVVLSFTELTILSKTYNAFHHYGTFIYSCFLKPHSGDGTGNQQDALESFYSTQVCAACILTAYGVPIDRLAGFGIRCYPKAPSPWSGGHARSCCSSAQVQG